MSLPLPLAQAGLLENTVQSTGGQVVARMPGDSQSPGLGPMLELTMATLRGHQVPAVLFD